MSDKAGPAAVAALMKRESPYTRLQRAARQFAHDVAWRKRVSMFFYVRANLRAPGYRLDDLYERVAAAQQLGWTVELSAKDDGLHVHYVQPLPEASREFRP